jgi:hypothetical protein
MGMAMMPFGMKTGILLIAMALGYVVLYLAKREEKQLKTAGNIIGIFIIAVSAALILCNIICKARFCGSKFQCRKMMMQGQKPPMPMHEQAPQ